MPELTTPSGKAFLWGITLRVCLKLRFPLLNLLKGGTVRCRSNLVVDFRGGLHGADNREPGQPVELALPEGTTLLVCNR